MRVLGFFCALSLLATVLLAMERPLEETALSDQYWTMFKTRFGKTYEKNSTVDVTRKSWFLNAKRTVDEHNKLYNQRKVNYKLELNKFADWSNEEYNQLNGLRVDVLRHQPFIVDRMIGGGVGRSPYHRAENSSTFFVPVGAKPSASIDWRKLGYVTPVKNQKQCGSCWAFSATGALEAQHKRETGRLVSLSEQQLVDCSRGYNNHGCHGGMPDRAFAYIKEHGGLMTEEEYPYEGVDSKCRYNASHNATEATTTGYKHIRFEDEYHLKVAIAHYGPMAVAIDADGSKFRYYKSGIYYYEDCDKDYLNHAVLAVGYGSDESGGDYWIIKNSWGEDWGDEGYIKIARNRGNHCGVATIASLPLI